MMTRLPSSGTWVGLALAACAWIVRATAADPPAELPPPAAVADRKDGGKAEAQEAETQEANTQEAEANREKPDPSDGRCDRCDGCSCVRRVCVAKRTEKEITKVCWSYRTEDFCIPGPSIYCGEKCLRDTCGCWTHSLWKPTCAEVRTRRVPVKTTVNRKIPGVEWRVEERCQECRVLCFGIAHGSAERTGPTGGEE